MNPVVRHGLPIAIGFAADLVLGDPQGLPHPVRLVGKLISVAEEPLRHMFPDDASGQLAAGAALAGIVTSVSTATAAALVRAAGALGEGAAVAIESLICYQMLATRSLRDESMKVADELEAHDLEGARQAVGMIVGRDTGELDGEAIVRAAVETIAENTSDGVVAPLLYMAVAGATGAVLYKAVNTMDSMVGYRNDRYRCFGTAAARLDDVLNLVPARVAGALMCLSAGPAGFDGARAWRIFKRDRLAHPSPNSAHTEAACAGALGVQLGGGSRYLGKYVEKPTIGDRSRPVQAADIGRANRLLYATAGAAFVLAELLVAGVHGRR